MSQMEHHIGKLIPVMPEQNETLGDQCHRIFDELVKLEGGKSEYYEGALFDEYYKEYVSLDGRLHKMDTRDIEDDPSDCNEMRRGADGTLHINTRFYNGGTCLSEMVESAYDNLNKKQA